MFKLNISVNSFYSYQEEMHNEAYSCMFWKYNTADDYNGFCERRKLKAIFSSSMYFL